MEMVTHCLLGVVVVVLEAGLLLVTMAMAAVLDLSSAQHVLPLRSFLGVSETLVVIRRAVPCVLIQLLARLALVLA